MGHVVLDGPAIGPRRVEVSLGRGGCGCEGKLERGLEHGWRPGKSWPYLRKAGKGFFVCLFLL